VKENQFIQFIEIKTKRPISLFFILNIIERIKTLRSRKKVGAFEVKKKLVE
jgi:hypothetical protein